MATVKKNLFNLSPRGYVGAMVALLMVFFLALNVFSGSSFRGARVDLTDNGLFTLSQGTLNTIRSLKEPVRLQFFYSETVGADIVQLRTYATRVRDLLEEYAARSGGKIKLEIVDPEPFTEAEDIATAHGLQAAQTPSGESLFFGLVGTNAIDGKEVVPFFPQDRAAFLEYDLTEMIHRLNAPEKPVLGIVTNLPLDTGPGGLAAAMQGMGRPFVIYEQLRERFDIEMLEQDFAAVPETVDVLMIAHPKVLTDETLYAIDQFVLRGGRALVFVDPYSELGTQRGPTGQPLPGSSDQSDLAKLFGAWGVVYDAGKVVADVRAAQVVTANIGGRPARASYPIWLGLTPDHLAQDDLVTAQIGQLNLATAGALSRAENAPTTFQPLITVTPESMLLDRMQVVVQPSPEDLLTNFAPTPETYTIAARITGPVSSAYPNGKPTAPEPAEGQDATEVSSEAETTPAEHIPSSSGPINVIVVADSDIFDDQLWVSEQNLFGQRIAVPVADNGNFVINAVDNLMGSNDLISLRTRSSGERPFTVVDNLRRNAEMQFLAQEQALQQQLTEAEAQLRQLYGQGEGLDAAASATLSAEEEALVERVRLQMIDTRRALRDVRGSLRADIESLGGWLVFFNVIFVPLVVAGIAITLAWMRSKRRATRLAAGR